MRTPIILLLATSLVSCALFATDAQLAQVDSLHQPKFTAPPAGESSRTRFTVELQREVLRPCISIGEPRSKVKLLVSQLLLEHLVARGHADPHGYQGRYRNDLLADRANGILLTASDVDDGYGCKQTKGRIPFDSDYLLGALMDSGQLVAMHVETGQAAKAVSVQFNSFADIEGHVGYSIDGQSILAYRTWVH